MLSVSGSGPMGGGGGGGGGGVLSVSGPGPVGEGGGIPSGKEGRGEALYYINGFTTAPCICPCFHEILLT